MSAVRKLTPISVADYLALEETSAIRHERVDGELIAMVGTSQRHNLMAGNLFVQLHQRLHGQPCRVFMSDIKVRVDDNFYYPDLVVSCQPGELTAHSVEQPKLIIEILSRSTQGRDRYEKRLAYQRLASLQEYVLVEQNSVQVEVYRRLTDGWEVETYAADEQVHLTALDLHIPMAAIYADLIPQLPSEQD